MRILLQSEFAMPFCWSRHSPPDPPRRTPSSRERPDHLPGTAIQDLTIIGGTPLESRGRPSRCIGLSGYGTITLNRDTPNRKHRSTSPRSPVGCTGGYNSMLGFHYVFGNVAPHQPAARFRWKHHQRCPERS